MGWNSSTQTMSLPISIGDIGTAVGYSSGTLGNIITDGIANGLITKWAKYKPVRYANVWDTSGQYDSATSAWKSSATWWKSTDLVTEDGVSQYTCGLGVKVYTSLESLKSAYDSAAGVSGTSKDAYLGWTYNAPRGYRVTSGADQHPTEPYRVFDFIQYYKGAVCPMNGMTSPASVSPSGTMTIVLNANSATSPLALGLTDIPVVSARYFGVALYTSSGSLYGMMTGSQTIGGASTVSQATSLQVPVPTTEATYYIYPFLSRQSQSTWASTDRMTVHSFIPVPFDRGAVVVKNAGNTKSYTATAVLTRKYASGAYTYTLTWTITFYGLTSSSTTYSGVTAQVGIKTGNDEYTISSYWSTSVSSVTISASGTSTPNTASRSGTVTQASRFDTPGTNEISAQNMQALWDSANARFTVSGGGAPNISVTLTKRDS